MTSPITATRRIDTTAATVFGFLGELENHWRLSPCFQVLELDRNDLGAATGGTIRVRGPIGLRRTVRTRVEEVDPPTGMRGSAVAEGMRAEVSWQIESGAGACVVTLSVRVVRPSWRDRTLFALGGTRWLRRQFEGILEELGEQVAAA